MQQKHPIVRMSNITMRFGDNLVLDDVSIALEKGMAHCLMGYNGSGKSTLAKILSGEQPATAGTIEFDGAPCPLWSTVEAVARGVVIVGGFSCLLPHETVYQNMQYSLVPGRRGALSLLGQRRRLLREIDDFIGRYGLRCTARTQVLDMSNGDRVLLELFRAKLMGVRVLLIDEIDVVLGSRHKKLIGRLIGELKERGTAILYISHKLDMVLALADRVSLMQYGKVIPIAEEKSFAENDIIQAFFSHSLERPPRLHKNTGEQLLAVERAGREEEFFLELYEGEILGIYGMGGTGGSGFYHMLFSEDPRSTEVRIHGRRARGVRMETALANGIVLMSSALMHLTVYSGYSVRQNMLPFNVVKRVRSEERRNEICQRYINILNIRTTPGAKFDTLSLGHQRKVFLARSILSKGDIFIFDNPTDSIDSISKIDIYNIINEMKARGKGILLISNDLQELLGISDRIVTMRGRHITGHFETNRNSSQKLMEYLKKEGADTPDPTTLSERGNEQ